MNKTDLTPNTVGAQEKRALNPQADAPWICKGPDGKLDTKLIGLPQFWAKLTVGLEGGPPEADFLKAAAWLVLQGDEKAGTRFFQDLIRAQFE